jgi:hypothetical protein
MGVRRSLAGIPAGVLGCSVALVLGACGGGDDSVADPPVSSTTSSPTESPQHESAEHFIRRFANVERVMENSGRVTEYLELTQSCRPCRELAKQVRGFYRDGGYIHWSGWRIKDIQPYDAAKHRPNSFAVQVISAPTEYRESASGPVKHLDGGPATEIVAIRRAQDSWVVTARARLSS